MSVAEQAAPTAARGRWPRWLGRIALAGVALALLVRLALPLWLPPLLDDLVARHGLALEYDDLGLSVLDGRLDLRGVTLAGRPSADGAQDPAPGQPLATLAHLGIDLDLSALLGGTLRAHRATLEGLELELERGTDGRWNFEAFLGTGEPGHAVVAEAGPVVDRADNAQSESPTDVVAAAPRALDLSSPIEITSAGIGARVHLVDALADPPLDTRIALDLSLVDLGHEVRPTRLSVSAWAPELLEALHLDIRARSGPRALQADVACEVAGIGAARLAPYLEPLGLRPHARRLDLAMHARVELEPLAPEDPEGVDTTGVLHIEGVSLAADLEPQVSLESISARVDRASWGGAILGEVSLAGLRAQAERLEDGTLRVAGLDLVGGGAPAEDDDVEPEASEPRGPFALEVARLALEDARLVFEDRAVEPAAQLDVELAAEVRELVLDPERPGTPLSLSASISARDTGRLALDGSAVPGGERPRLELSIRGDELTLGALAPHLAASGLRSTLTAGTFAAQLAASAELHADGALDVRLALDEVELRDGETELFGLDTLALTGAHARAGGTTRLEELTLSGGRLPLWLDGDGSVRTLGVATLPTVDGDELDGDVVRIEGFGLQLRGLVLGSTDTETATLELGLAAVGLADALELSGEITTRPGPLDVDARLVLAGRGLRADAVRSLLARGGVESTLTGAELGLRVDLAARRAGDTLEASAGVHELALEDAGRELLALEALELEGLTTGPQGTSIASVLVRGPSTGLARDAEGRLEVLGMRLAGATTPSDLPGAPDVPETPPPRSGAPDDRAAIESGASAPFSLDRLTLEGARVTWRDSAVAPAVDTALELGATVESFSTATGSAPVTFGVALAVPGSLEELALTGTARLALDDLAVESELALRGVRAGQLASYLPPEVSVLLEDGRLGLSLEVTSAAHDDGGRSATLVVADLDLHDGEQGEPLLGMDALRVEIARFDDRAGFLDLERVSVEGLALDVRRSSPERLELFGIALDQAPGSTPPPSPDAGVAEVAPEDPPAGDPSSVAAAPRSAPTVRLGFLDVGIERLRYRDDTRPDTERLELGLSLSTPGPLELSRPDPSELPPIQLTLTGAARPLVDSIEGRLTLAPFLQEPELAFELAVTGLNGAALERTLPDLAQAVDTSAFAGGSFTANGEARLLVRRRGPIDFDLRRGFGAQVVVRDVALRPVPDGEVLAGFERLDVEVKRVQPTTGDVDVAAIELTGTRARVVKEAGGLRVAGILFLRAPQATESTQPTETIETGEGQAAEPDPTGAPLEAALSQDPGDVLAAEARPVAAGPEIKVGRLLVSGLDFVLRDETVEPPLVVPIEDMELEIRRFTTLAFTEPRPISFHAVVDAGTVELPERTPADNLLTGVLGSVAGVLGGGEEDFELEERRLWDLVDVAGRLTLAPKLEGRVQIGLLGLELPAFRAAAAASGVVIGDGLVDSKLSLSFRGDGGVSIDSKTTFTYLSLSEPPDGPISQYLALPAPLDTVLYLLRDDAGQQTIPLRLNVGADGVGGGAIARAAGTAIGHMITDALASAPMRLLGPLTDVIGLTGAEPEPLSADSLGLSFPAGASVADRDQLAELEQLVRRMQQNENLRVVVQHELGGGDVAKVAALANPRPEESAALVTRLRDRKAALERQRAQLSEVTRVQYAVGFLDGARVGTAQLQHLDRERASVEAGLDRVFELLRPGAERRRDQRTRAAALALGQARLERVQAALVASGGPALAERVEVRRARWDQPEGEEGGRVTLTPRMPK